MAGAAAHGARDDGHMYLFLGYITLTVSFLELWILDVQ